MTRKDYELIARCFRERGWTTTPGKQQVCSAHAIAEALGRAFANFNTEAFLEACVPEKPTK